MRRFKRGIAFLLAVILLVSLAGCGKDKEDKGNGEPKKEFVYVPEYKDLDLSVNYINSALASGDDLYMFGEVWNEQTGEGKTVMYQYHLLDGTYEELTVNLEPNAYMQGITFDNEGNLLAIVNRTVYPDQAAEGAAAGEEGEAEEGTQEDGNAEDSEAEDGAEAIDTSAGTGTEDISNVSLSAVAVTETVVGSDYAGTSSYPVETEMETYIELLTLSAADGSVLSNVDIKGIFDNAENAYVQYLAVNAEGTIFLSADSKIYAIDKEGKKLFDISVDTWINNMFVSKEGDIYVTMYGNEGMEVRPVDTQTRSLGTALEGELVSNSLGYNSFYYKGINESLLIGSDSKVETYDFATDTKTELFHWLDVDLNRDDIQAFGELSDGRFWVLLNDRSGETNSFSLTYLTKTKASEVVQKTELVYGTLWMDQDVRKNIINFNKTNDTYRITVKEYNTDDYTTGLTNFNTDLTSGSGPDLINIAYIDFGQYAAKGVFEDLYPYMEKDGIQRENYLENVFKAYEEDGKLYGILPQFYVTSTLAKASKVSGNGWTLSEMLDFVEKNNPENIFQYGSRYSIFYYCIYNTIDEFINWETGECFFNGDDFIRVLEFANQFPEEADYSQQEEGTSSMIRSDKILLMQTSISSVQEYQMMNGLFGEEVNYVGYPNSERKGNMIQPTGGSMAINAKSENKDGAWEFIKSFLSEEYQNSLVRENNSWGFPVSKAALEKQFKQDMTPEYYEDENGNKIEQTKTTWGYDDFEIEIYAATQEEIDAVREIITSAERIAGSTNEELINIITEETAPFFKGQKTAKETADIIQNRIQIYVSENR